VIPQAAAAANASQSPGLFLLAWGVLASVFGIAAVTNFRGFADNAANRAAARAAARRRPPPPWKWPQSQNPAERTKQMRILGIPFAIIGPIVTIVGLVSFSQGRTGGSGPPALPGPARYLVIAFGVAAIGWSWLSPRGVYRPAAGRGGWRLAAAAVSSLCALVFIIGFALGQLTMAIAGWIVGGLTTAVLMMDGKPPGPGPENKRSVTTPRSED
jgi:hypothetical protein